ncbi:MAG: YjbQ family protein [Deltaproteobacteria bacterium]|nr:YjbQ family protein [Deltaproteobacteria bacterium]
MKVFTGTVRIKSNAKAEEINITNQAEAMLAESGVQDGIAIVFTGHTTASVHLGNADKELEKDFHDFLSDVVVNKPTYRHNNKGDYGKNADAHFKAIMVGNSVTVPVTRGRLSLGQWQAIYFSEFDGPRARLISIRIMGGQAGQ